MLRRLVFCAFIFCVPEIHAQTEAKPEAQSELQSLTQLYPHFLSKPPLSAVPVEGEDWETTLEKRMGLTAFSSGSAYNEAKTFDQINDFSALPEWPGTASELAGYFANARDERIYEDENGFKRRSTWLYPEDGCHTRAAHIARSFESIPMPRPGKVFAFGIPLGPPIGLYSRFSRDPQKKTWWLFHVAAAYRLNGEVIVLDPAVDSLQPLRIRTWLGRMIKNPARAKVSVCDTYAYDPESLCQGGSPERERNSLEHQRAYFSLEWQRLIRLNFEPSEYLGPNPPWSNPDDSTAAHPLFVFQ